MAVHFPAFISSDDSNFGPLDTLISTHLQNGSLRIVYKRNITLNYIRNSQAYNARTNIDPGNQYKKWKRPYDFARSAGAVLRNMVVTVTHDPLRQPRLPKQGVNVRQNNNLAWRLSHPVGIYHPIFDDIDDIPRRLKEIVFFSAVDKIFPHHEIQRRIAQLRAVNHDLAYFQDKLYAISRSGDVIWYVVVGWELRLQPNDETMYEARPTIKFYIIRRTGLADDGIVNPFLPPPISVSVMKQEYEDTRAIFESLIATLDGLIIQE